MKRLNIQLENLYEKDGVINRTTITQMAIICAAIKRSISKINNMEINEDILSTIEVLKVLGTEIKVYDKFLLIDGKNTFKKEKRREAYINSVEHKEIDTGRIPLIIQSKSSKKAYKIIPFDLKDNILINCGISTSTLELIVPLSISRGNKVKFIGRGNIKEVDLNAYYNIFNNQNIGYFYEENAMWLEINGELRGGEFIIEKNTSLQSFIGLLLAAPLLKETSTIRFSSGIKFEKYIDLILDIIKKFGIEVENHGYESLCIPGNQML